MHTHVQKATQTRFHTLHILAPSSLTLQRVLANNLQGAQMAKQDEVQVLLFLYYE